MQKHPAEVFYKKAVRKNFAIFTGKHLCWSLFLIKLKAFRSQEHLFLKTSANGCLVHIKKLDQGATEMFFSELEIKESLCNVIYKIDDAKKSKFQKIVQII